MSVSCLLNFVSCIKKKSVCLLFWGYTESMLKRLAYNLLLKFACRKLNVLFYFILLHLANVYRCIIIVRFNWSFGVFIVGSFIQPQQQHQPKPYRSSKWKFTNINQNLTLGVFKCQDCLLPLLSRPSLPPPPLPRIRYNIHWIQITKLNAVSLFH